MAQGYKNRMVSETTRPSKIKAPSKKKLDLQAIDFEKKYNEEVRLRKEAELALATLEKEKKNKLQLQAQTLEKKYENKMSRLSKENEQLLAKEREKVEKVKTQNNTLKTKLENMRSRAEEFESKYHKELNINRVLTKEKQKIERSKELQVESCISETNARREERDMAIRVVVEMKTKHKRETDAMQEERDNALKLVQEMETNQKRDADAMREEMEAKLKRETDALREERDNALGLFEEMETKQKEERECPSSFTCPISLEVMRDPHFTTDGHTYEAEEIRKWFALGHHTSPVTNAQLSHLNLVPNHALRSAIEKLGLS